MDRKKFGEQIKQLREAQGLTKTEVARRAGFTYRSVLYWEQGKKDITLENAAKLLDALGREMIFMVKREVRM